MVQTDIESILSNSIHQRNYAITAPPRHGKTSLVTIPLPAYYLHHNPKHEVIVGMHSQGIANKISKRTRAIVREDQGLGEMATLKEWETSQGGRYKATGVGGMIAGTGGHLLIADDLFPDRKHAESQVFRDTVHDWWQDDFITRANPQLGRWHPPTPIVLIMCMTGDTPVLMADGTEKQLRDVRPGDSVGTYDDGKLRASKVLKHKSNGSDSIYKLTTTSGRIVHANERHPFLVEQHGELKWVRLKHLTTACKIVTLKGNGASGRVRNAVQSGATSLPSVEACATRTMAVSGGRTVIEQHRTTQEHYATDVSRTATGSRSMSMKPCSPSRAASALFAANRLGPTSGHTGVENSVSTIATKLIPSEAYYATTAIWPLDTPRRKPTHSLLPDTCDFTTEQIVSIEPAGVAEVFDVQIEHTENFIANGVVSHNTRWHTDDIWGRVVNPEKWLIRRLPAICDYDEFDEEANIPCPFGRQPGDALAPQMWSVAELLEKKAGMSDYSWLALYQGRPTSKAGLFFDVTQFELCEHTPGDVEKRVRYFDFASSPDPDAAFTATVLMAMHADGTFTIEHIDKIQKGPGARDQWQRRYADMDARRFGEGNVRQVEEKQPGAAGKDRTVAWAKLMRGHSFGIDKIEGEGSKTTRADPFAATVAAGLCRIRKTSPYNKANPIDAFKAELRAFPMGRLKDWVDAGSGAHNYLTRTKGGGVQSGQGTRARREKLMQRRGRR